MVHAKDTEKKKKTQRFGTGYLSSKSQNEFITIEPTTSAFTIFMLNECRDVNQLRSFKLVLQMWNDDSKQGRPSIKREKTRG